MKSLLVIVILFTTLNSCKKKEQIVSDDLVSNTEHLDAIDSTKPQVNNITKTFVLGKFDYESDSSFVKVHSKYSSKKIYIQKETYEAFLKMHKAAKNDGIGLTILSGTRNFYEQKAIWNRKWKRYNNLNPLDRSKKILEYSSMPSTSRHHWGTDIDLNNLNNSYFNSLKGNSEYQWLTEHANEFGFYQVYTNKSKGRTGYEEEKWHWSYLPLADTYLDFYNANVTAKDISDFEGSALSEDLNIITDFVNGISNQAKNYKN